LTRFNCGKKGHKKADWWEAKGKEVAASVNEYLASTESPPIITTKLQLGSPLRALNSFWTGMKRMTKETWMSDEPEVVELEYCG